MAILVVGGHSHNIGKTSVAAGLIAAFPHLNWTAIKITRHGDAVCPLRGAGCGCAPSEHLFSIASESNRLNSSDTSRFLAAGASLSYWVQVKPKGLEAAAPEILRIVRDSPFAIIESNSILRYLQPDLYIVVLSPDITDWKTSAGEFLEKAGLAVVIGRAISGNDWNGGRREVVARLPKVYVSPPQFVTQELLDMVQSRLTLPSKADAPF